MKNSRLYIGIDVGSTTIKAVVKREGSDKILWKDYQRHEIRQAEKSLEFRKKIETQTQPNDYLVYFFTWRNQLKYYEVQYVWISW